MTEYNIAVTGLNAADTPCPGISVIRSLKQYTSGLGGIKINIIGLVYELLCSVSYADNIVDQVYYVPFPQEDEDRYLERLSEITKKTKIDMLIPNLDFEIPVMSRLEPELRDIGIKMLVPEESSVSLCRKENLAKLASLCDAEIPYSIVFNDRRQISQTAANFTYPVIIKAANGEACVVYSMEEAIVFSMRLLSLWGAPLIMQRFVKGDEYCVASLSDRRQKIIGSVCMKKILKSRNGTAWMGVTAKDDFLVKLSKNIVEKLKWIGPIEIECIKEQTSQKYFLIEINPRFPTWIQLAAEAGCNLPLLSVQSALHQKIEPDGLYKSGILFARSIKDISCDISRLGKLATERELIYNESKRHNR